METAMRRKDRQVDAAEAKRILAEAEYGILSTVCEDGAPYGVPLSFVVTGDAIYFHCAKAGRKPINIEADNRVCFTAVGATHPEFLDNFNFTTRYESAIAFGRARAVEDAQEKQKALYLLCEKYLPEFIDAAEASIEKSLGVTAVYRIDIESISGKANRA